MKLRLMLSAVAVALALAGCTWTADDTNAKLEQAKAMAAQVRQVVNSVCDVVPQASALATAVLGAEPTTIAIATVATTICVAVRTPNTMSSLADTCPGGVTVNGVCVPLERPSP
jgi:hypothetical protein